MVEDCDIHNFTLTGNCEITKPRHKTTTVSWPAVLIHLYDSEFFVDNFDRVLRTRFVLDFACRFAKGNCYDNRHTTICLSS